MLFFFWTMRNWKGCNTSRPIDIEKLPFVQQCSPNLYGNAFGMVPPEVREPPPT